MRNGRLNRLTPVREILNLGHDSEREPLNDRYQRLRLNRMSHLACRAVSHFERVINVRRTSSRPEHRERKPDFRRKHVRHVILVGSVRFRSVPHDDKEERKRGDMIAYRGFQTYAFQ